jgi:glucose-6-phosphate 1-dehydrogenase
VPFLIRVGKSLPVTETEVIVTLWQPPLGRFVPGRNYFRFRLGPEMSLDLGALVKKPGMAMTSDARGALHGQEHAKR